MWFLIHHISVFEIKRISIFYIFTVYDILKIFSLIWKQNKSARKGVQLMPYRMPNCCWKCDMYVINEEIQSAKNLLFCVAHPTLLRCMWICYIEQNNLSTQRQIYKISSFKWYFNWSCGKVDKKLKSQKFERTFPKTTVFKVF